MLTAKSEWEVVSKVGLNFVAIWDVACGKIGNWNLNFTTGLVSLFF
jgi:hypothetical protein